MTVLQAHKHQQFHITLANSNSVDALVQEFHQSVRIDPVRVSVSLQGDPNSMVRTLAKYDIKGFTMEEESLEKIFMNHYGKEAM